MALETLGLGALSIVLSLHSTGGENNKIMKEVFSGLRINMPRVDLIRVFFVGGCQMSSCCIHSGIGCALCRIGRECTVLGKSECCRLGNDRYIHAIIVTSAFEMNERM